MRFTTFGLQSCSAPSTPSFLARSSRLLIDDGLQRVPPRGEKGYDSDAIRRQVEKDGAMPNIPTSRPRPIANGRTAFSPFLYRNRNAIERMFCRLKDFRRIATRYDRNAANFLAAVCIAATVSYWL
jgi:hypothetical protein